jgi:nucleoside-diphosphate-sugar epimerase
VRRLVADGWRVRALARSDAAAAKVRALGAEPVRGDLSDVAAMSAGAAGCELAFHCAAHLGDWGRREDFERDNVQGTHNALDATRQGGVRRFVHVGTEAALLAGQPLVEADEHAPLRFDSKALYSATKARAEEAVIEANGPELETVVVRPRFVWGRGDTTLLPQIAAAARSGRWAWVGGGTHRTSTTHVENVVHGLLLGAERGAAGGVYFVTDGTPVVFREFVTRLLATQGIDAPSRVLPRPVARAVAAAGETAWSALPLPGRPPLTRFAYWVSALECTIDITRARTELGYEPVKAVDEGMRELEPAG